MWSSESSSSMLERFRSDGSPASADGLPVKGDIVIGRTGAPAAYTVRQYPGAVQCSFTSHDEALRIFSDFAQSHAVDLWYCDGRHFVRLGQHRPPRSVANN